MNHIEYTRPAPLSMNELITEYWNFYKIWSSFIEEKKPLLEFIEAEMVENTLVTVKKEQKIHKKTQIHQRRNYVVKGSYCT